MTASFNSDSLRNGLNNIGSDKYDDASEKNFDSDDSASSSPSSSNFADTQMEIFNHQHGVLILHVLATLMFVPSAVSWFQASFCHSGNIVIISAVRIVF